MAVDPLQVAQVRAVVGERLARFAGEMRAKGYPVEVEWHPHDSDGARPDVVVRLWVPGDGFRAESGTESGTAGDA